MSQRRIFTTDPNDVVAAVLAELGYDNTFIRARTRLSDGAIAYRMKFLGIKRADYRSGRSRAAKLVLSTVEEQVGGFVAKRVGYATGKRRDRQ